MAYFCPNLVAMATSIAPLKMQIAYLNSATPNTISYIQKVSRYLVQNRNEYKLALLCPNLIAMAIPFAPLKIQITYLNSPTPKTTPYMQKVSRYLYRSEISAILGYIFPKFGCHGNALWSLENLNNMFEFADPENYTLHAKSVSISLQN